MSQFRRRLLVMMQKVQEIWRDVVMTGTGIVIANDTTEGQSVKVFPQGWTEQVQTTGKNLLPDKFSIYAEGKSKTNLKLQIGNYVYSSKTSKNLYILHEDKSNITNGWTATNKFNFKIDKEETIEVRIETENPLEILPMIRDETELDSYEPYTGGKPSPSPEYPQEIKNSGKWNEEKQKYEVDVKVVGKNLFDVNYFAESENYQNKEGDATYWKYATFKVKPNTTYTVSKRKSLNVNGAINNGIYYGGALAFNNDVNSVKITTKDDGVFYVIFFYRSEDVNILKEMDIQIELGETLTEYEPYKEQTLTLTSDRPLTKWDKLVEQDGQIGWLYNSANETIDGKTGKWSIQPASKILYRTDITFPIVVPFCIELLGYDYLMGGYKKDTGITINNLGILCITLPEEVELTLDAYKQYLADNPLHVLYKDDSEEFVPLSESEQDAIRALKTYYPTTVISNDQNAFMQIEYRTKYGGES